MAIEWKTSALSDLEKLDTATQDQVIDRVIRASENPKHYLERLVGLPFYKLRCGDWRVFVDWQRPRNNLFILRVLHRKKAYDRL